MNKCRHIGISCNLTVCPHGGKYMEGRGGGGCGGGGQLKPKGILNSNQMQISVMVAVRISNNLELFAVKVRVVNKRYK
jgi:hypothetical protein